MTRGPLLSRLSQAFVDSTGQTPEAGHYFSPAAVNIEAYGKTWIDDIMGIIGAGENTSDPTLIELGRSLRHPFQTKMQPANLTKAQLRAFQAKHAEVIEIDYVYRSKTSPTVPATIADAPNVLTPRNFGIYPA